MPTYEYECDGCRRVLEVRQRISEPPLTTCDTCGGQLRRLISAAPFILKGDGWYVTDYPSEDRKKALQAEKGSSGTGDTTSTTDKSGDKSGSPAAGAAATAAPKDGGSSGSTASGSSAPASSAPGG